MKKEYSYKIYELKDGSRHPKLLRDEYTTASNKKEAFAEAKEALFRIANFEFEVNCIKEEFEDIYLQAGETKNFDALDDLQDKLGYWGVYDENRITGVNDYENKAQFTRGDTSYCSSRNASAVYLKVFSKKIKRFVVPKP